MKLKSICEVEGVEDAGIKEGKYGLALIKASGNAAAVFTKNQVMAEPVSTCVHDIFELTPLHKPRLVTKL